MRNCECFSDSVFRLSFLITCFCFIYFSPKSTPPVFTPQLIEQFKLNVYHYAELLFRWQFYDKRLELLKAINRRDGMLVPIRTEVNRIGMFFFAHFVTIWAGRHELNGPISYRTSSDLSQG